MNMPINEHAIATAPGSALAAVSRPALVRLKPSARVRDREEHSQRLNQLVLLHADRLQEWHRGNHLHAGSGGNHAGDTPTMPPPHFSFWRSMLKFSFAQANDGIERQQQAERDCGIACIGTGQRPGVQPDARGGPISNGHSRRMMSRK